MAKRLIGKTKVSVERGKDTLHLGGNYALPMLHRCLICDIEGFDGLLLHGLDLNSSTGPSTGIRISCPSVDAVGEFEAAD